MEEDAPSFQQETPRPEELPSAPPTHRKYLRAFHDYQPDQDTISGSAGGISVTASLKTGDIVLVHLTHPNGWADGTILSTGTRGWIPSNYCQVYDPLPIRALLQALTRLWDYLSAGTNGTGLLEDRQDYVQGLIAGVRRMLDKCECLHRDKPLIQKHIGLRRTRKSLLSDLSFLIKCREEIHKTFANPSDEVLWSSVDQYLSSAFKVACRAVRFLDLWNQCTSTSTTTSTHLRSESVNSDILDSPQEKKALSLWPAPYIRPKSIEERQPQAIAVGEPKLRLRIVEPEDATHNHEPTEVAVRAALREPRRSLLLTPTSPGVSPHKVLQASPTTFTRIGSGADALSDFASEQLTAAHEKFLGNVGAFIGLHLQSRTSLDLSITTQRSIEAAEGLLLVVNRIAAQAPGRSQGVITAVGNMRNNLAKLAEHADRLCLSKTPDAMEEPEIIEIVDPEEGQGLVAAATSCVRAAGDCTAKARKLLDHITGDFLLDTHPTVVSKARNRISEEEVGKVTPRGEAVSEQWSQVAPGAANPHYGESVVASEALSTPGRPAYLLRSTTDGTNNRTLSSVVPSGNMRRSESTPPLITCDSPTTPSKSQCSAKPTPESPERLSIERWTPPARKQSLGMPMTPTSSAYPDSFRNSVGSAISQSSTRATTPDKYHHFNTITPTLCSSRSVLSVATDNSDHEAEVLVRSHAHELLFNKEGQIVGGTLAALVENLTSQHSPPDPMYYTTFFLTFRLFTNAVELSKTLVERYQHAGDYNSESSPARLRVYNFFKTWLESHYSSEADALALPIIQSFAIEILSQQFAGSGKRLAGLVEKASQRNIIDAESQIVSAVGKTSVAMGTDYATTLIPHANINKDQLYLLIGPSTAGRSCSIMDLDATEIARQLTILESKIFCAIQPQELVGLEWTKKPDNKAVNVRETSRFSTDLTHFVCDTILSINHVKKRALVLRHWIRIAKICLDICNFSSMMAIACSLTASPIIRLRMTWDLVPTKAKVAFEEIKEMVDFSRNCTALRQRLPAKAPCLPFLGMYLTDLTFIDAGNTNTRVLPHSGDDESEPRTVINFDKHVRSANTVSLLQRYQVPYRFQHVKEIQDWLEINMSRVRNGDECSVQVMWRRSQELEPKSLPDERRSDVEEKDKEKEREKEREKKEEKEKEKNEEKEKEKEKKEKEKEKKEEREKEKREEREKEKKEEKEKATGGSLMSGRLRPKNKPSVIGLNAFVARGNDLLSRVKTSSSNSTD